MLYNIWIIGVAIILVGLSTLCKADFKSFLKREFDEDFGEGTIFMLTIMLSLLWPFALLCIIIDLFNAKNS